MRGRNSMLCNTRKCCRGGGGAQRAVDKKNNLSQKNRFEFRYGITGKNCLSLGEYSGSTKTNEKHEPRRKEYGGWQVVAGTYKVFRNG